MSDRLWNGLYKGMEVFGKPDHIVFFYNDGHSAYGWWEWGQSISWDKVKQERVEREGWFIPSVVRWATLTPANELEFLILTGREFKKPDGA